MTAMTTKWDEMMNSSTACYPAITNSLTFTAPSACFSLPFIDSIEPVVKCKNCKHRPIKGNSWNVVQPPLDESGEYDETCPFLIEDPYYNKIPEDDFYCARGEKK